MCVLQCVCLSHWGDSIQWAWGRVQSRRTRGGRLLYRPSSHSWLGIRTLIPDLSPVTPLYKLIDFRKQGGLGLMKIPLISDITIQIAKDYGVYMEDLGHTQVGLTHTQISVCSTCVTHFKSSGLVLSLFLSSHLQGYVHHRQRRCSETCDPEWPPSRTFCRRDLASGPGFETQLHTVV